MASPAELGQNLPDTLPEDFGGWDESESPANAPAEAPASGPPELAPRERRQKEYARREAEAIDLAKRNYAPREVVSDYEPANNSIPSPGPDPALLAMRGYPAPAARAPRSSPPPPQPRVAPAPAPVQNDAAFLRKVKTVNSVVDKLPGKQSRVDEIAAITASVMEQKPERQLFSSVAATKSRLNEAEDVVPRRLNEIVEQEEESKAKRKWIMSGSVFGVALLLVAFQLIHHSMTSKQNHVATTTQVSVPVPESNTMAPEQIADANQAAAKPAAGKPAQGADSQTESATSEEPVVAPVKPVQSQLMQTQLTAPTKLPQDAKGGRLNDAPPPAAIGGMDALNGNSSVGNVFGSKSSGQVSGPKVLSVSAGVAVGMLVRKTQPVYPPIARSARVQGTVTLQATITKTGSVTNIRVMAGPPMLRQAAIDAVRTWQYKPYALNSIPTDVDTTINVVFSLGG